MCESIECDNDTGGNIVSWLRYEYEGLNLLRIDQLYDGNFSGTIDSTDYTNKYWRPMNIYLHGPGAIGQIIKSKWYSYTDDQTATPCTTGEYYYFYDAVGNVVGVWDQRDGAYHSWAMDAFGNALSGVVFLAMDQPGPKEHLTGKMFDTVTGLYYFAARWYDPEVGRFVSRDKRADNGENNYLYCRANSLSYADPNGKEEINNMGINIPEYVKIRKKKGCGAIGSCKCTRKDLPALNDFLGKVREMLDYNENAVLENEEDVDVSRSRGETIADTTCVGVEGSGQATITWHKAFGLECLDRCVLQHELIHAEQCRIKGGLRYHLTANMRNQEAEAYADTVDCLQKEKEKILNPHGMFGFGY